MMISKLPIIIVLFLPNRSIMNPLRRLPSIWTGEPRLTEKRQYLTYSFICAHCNVLYCTVNVMYCTVILWKVGKLEETWIVSSLRQRNWDFATNFFFKYLYRSLVPDCVNLCYFRLRLFDLTEFIVLNILSLQHWKLQKIGIGKFFYNWWRAGNL